VGKVSGACVWCGQYGENCRCAQLADKFARKISADIEAAKDKPPCARCGREWLAHEEFVIGRVCPVVFMYQAPVVSGST
jgi:hypothetical protein